ncbi:MAG: nucleotidyltransferase family protein [Gemmatimonadetes bacterium]|nr:nucleotidyltransferase family protein [Gemmatimonadota bacterium]
MSRTEPAVFDFPTMRNLSKEERKSVTHSEFWIPEEERELYKRCLNALNAAGVPCVVAGAYAIYEHTGIIRQTKDLDLFCTPEAVLQAMRVLRQDGFITRLEQSHWLAKAVSRDNPEHFIDIIYGMGNGLALIDDDWYRHSTPAILAATQVRVAPPEELLWHRLFINERHRHDMADIAHLILCVGHQMDWKRLVAKTGDDWPLLLSQLLMFRYVYPGYRDQVPQPVLRELLERADESARQHSADGQEHELTRGTLISRFSFAIDVNEWGFHDLRAEKIRAMQRHPAVVALEQSDVWDERADHEDPAALPKTVDEEE